MRSYFRRALSGLSLTTALALSGAVMAETAYGPGVTDTEIKIGQTIAYSGPASLLSVMGEIQTAYFDKLNAEGGINGRKVVLLSEDDGYNPPKTVEVVRRLVEQEEVLAIMGSNGTATNLAVRDYLTANSVPHLFILGGNWNDPANFPMTTGASHAYQTEGRLYARYLAANYPDKTIAILFQNDDYGSFLIEGLREEMGDAADDKIVMEVSYDRADPTIDSQLAQLASSGADIYLDVTYGKFTAQSIRNIAGSSWRPLHMLVYGGASAILQLEEGERILAKDIISATFYKTPNDPQFADDPEMIAYKEFVAKWAPEVSPDDPLGLNGYVAASLTAHVLEAAGDDLTRENLVKVATNLDQLKVPLLLPGITISTTPEDYSLFRAGRIQRFDGTQWNILDDITTLE